MNLETTTEPKLDQQLSTDVHAAVEKTLGQMFGMEVKSTFKPLANEPMPAGDITSVLTLNTKTPIGALVLTFPQQTLFTLLKEFYKKDFTEINGVVTGAVGEITNIVYGVFKFRLREKGYQFALAMPQVTKGPASALPNTDWTMCGEFTSRAGTFHVALVRTKDAA